MSPLHLLTLTAALAATTLTCGAQNAGLWDFNNWSADTVTYTTTNLMPMVSDGASPVTMNASISYARNFATDYNSGFNQGTFGSSSSAASTNYSVTADPERTGITTQWSETINFSFDKPLDFGALSTQSAANQNGFLFFQSMFFGPSVYPSSSVTFTIDGGGVFADVASSQNVPGLQFTGIGTGTVTATWSSTPDVDEIGYRSVIFDTIKISGEVDGLTIVSAFSSDSTEPYAGTSRFSLQSGGATVVPEPATLAVAALAAFPLAFRRRRI